ncbi:MAG: 2-oxoacid:ferredoxin oxidoreductase subunit beta [Candidatus Schekmanbacteria bacterium]|nr:2-oxoacid:ferredoxin oxidoreductase subunit beta [Candidatus Schekmanbacteria bacterium]
MISLKEIATGNKPTWCPGCGDYGILNAVKIAIAKAGLNLEKTVLVSGIGCSSKLPQYVNTYAFEGIHGRVLPVATGIKLANNSLTVIGIAGDGDAYGIGTCHFIHGMRRNLDLTNIVHDNQIYGLTTGQTSPTSEKGFATKSTPGGVIEWPVNPIALALASGATFIARGFVLELEHLTNLIVKGIRHKGFALIDIFQPCVTFNYLNTYQYYKQRCYKLEDAPGYNPQDKTAAHHKSQEWGERIPIGVFYQEQKGTYEDELPEIKEKPLAEQSITDVNIDRLLDECY